MDFTHFQKLDRTKVLQGRRQHRLVGAFGFSMDFLILSQLSLFRSPLRFFFASANSFLLKLSGAEP
jgi:hypothetical protein